MKDKAIVKAQARTRKTRRIRKHVRGTSERPRLAVFRSRTHIYAQLVDDSTQRTITSVSTLSKDLEADVKKAKTKCEKAKIVGKGIAQKAKRHKIKGVVFDRGGYLYHGRVKSVAEGAREEGLDF